MSSEAVAPSSSEAAAVSSSSEAGGDLGPLSYCKNSAPTSFDYYTERYYHQYLVENCKGVVGNNCRVLQHSNGLCVLCLDASHAACEAARVGTATVTSVSFGTGKSNSKVTPESIRVVGKRKKNALLCQADTRMCGVIMSDGTTYAIPACVNGFVLELNAALLETPTLLTTAPTSEGFIAVINPNAKMNMGTLRKVWVATGGDAPGEDEDE